MAGKFYCVGVGPGDFEYMTLKAKRIIDGCNTIAAPVKEYGEGSVALSIAKKASDLSEKNIIELRFSMSRDIKIRQKERETACDKVRDVLLKGTDVCMVTLGDVAIYSTCSYIINKLIAEGFSVETAAGVPSFSAAAAAANIRLCEGNERLAVIGAVKGIDDLDAILDMFDNVVIMKAGKKLDDIYKCLKKRGMENNALVCKNVGMENGSIVSLGEKTEAPYFTTVIIIGNGLR